MSSATAAVAVAAAAAGGSAAAATAAAAVALYPVGNGLLVVEHSLRHLDIRFIANHIGGSCCCFFPFLIRLIDAVIDEADHECRHNPHPGRDKWLAKVPAHIFSHPVDHVPVCFIGILIHTVRGNINDPIPSGLFRIFRLASAAALLHADEK